ncbi:MAG: hypothetical protein OXC11_00210 [Rhodospirillales bacterium]|nr:hypothetical protein [Rhodospirillales bacterium]
MSSGDEMLQRIVEKSALDTEFRQQLLADPNITEEQFEAISAGLCCCW